MKIYNSKEAAELLGISPTRVTQLIKPFTRAKRKHQSGLTRCFYTMEQIQAELARRATAAAEKAALRTAKELAAAGGRPGPDYLTLDEARAYTGRTGGVITYNTKITYRNKIRFFRKADLDAIPANADARPKKAVQKFCLQCGDIHKCRGDLCKRCAAAAADDRYNVRITNQLGTRRCKICGRPLFIGQYRCSKCRQDRRPADEYTQVGNYLDAYPGRALV